MVDLCCRSVRGSDGSSAAQSFSQISEHGGTERPTRASVCVTSGAALHVKCVCVCVGVLGSE